MSTITAVVTEKEEVKLVGFSVYDSLNNIIHSRIVGELREELLKRKEEIINRKKDGIYLMQVYSTEVEWTPDTPYEHVVGIEVLAHEELPAGMHAFTIPAGKYAEFVHEGPESEIGKTYSSIHEWLAENGYGGPIPFDVEFWADISTLENKNSHIEMFMPVGKR